MKFRGIIPALLTPFDEDGEVNHEAVKELVNRLVGEGIGGLFPCGSTGEWWALTQAERMGIVESVMEAAAGRVKVMVHVGAATTRFSVELARHAERAGADAISALPPTGAPLSSEAIWGHFKAIGESTRLPLYLYHMPQVYGDLITVRKFVEALDAIPTLAGVKFSSYRIDDLIHLRLEAGDRLNILSGCGEQLLSAMACGAEGSICTWYNLFPRLAGKIIELVEKNDIPGARKHEELLVAFAMLCKEKHIGNLKWLVGLRGIDVGLPRLPLPNPTPEERDALLPKLEEIGIFEWCI